jgi:hypothetical protein
VLEFVETKVYSLEERLRLRGTLKDVCGAQGDLPEENDDVIADFGGRAADGEIAG